jgi:PPOX class probable F420-dependent enzyme
MLNLDDVVGIAREDQFLAAVSTLRADGTIQTSIVNAGVLPHPVSGDDVVGFVTYGATKLANLRMRPQVAITFRSGWKWATVEGEAELIGPDDHYPTINAEGLRLLCREVFSAAGGTHGNWNDYDRTMAQERRTVVLVRPDRIYTNRDTA